MDRRDEPLAHSRRGMQEAGRRVDLWSARSALAAQAAFLILVGALHVLRPELDPSWRLVSEYVSGPFGGLMVAAFALSAVGCLALVPAVWRELATGTGRVGAAVLVVSALGLVVAAIFPTDPITTPPPDLSRTGRLHLAGAGLGMVAFPIAALLLSAALSGRTAFRQLRPALWLLTLSVWVALAALIPPMSVAVGSGFGPDVAIGWPHRLLLLVDSVWVLAVAGRVAWLRGRAGRRGGARGS